MYSSHFKTLISIKFIIFILFPIQVREKISAAGYRVTADTDAGDTMNKKIRNAQLSQHNFILVVGEKEQTNGTVNIRTRDNKVLGEHSIDKVIERFRYLSKERVLLSEDTF